MSNNAKVWYAVDPEGLEIEIVNLSHFCKEKNLEYSRMWSLINSKNSVRPYKGYMQSTKNSPSVHVGRDPITLEHEDGRRTISTNKRTVVASDAGISIASLHRLLKGDTMSCKGWRVVQDDEDQLEIDFEGEECL